jgi:CheY-like chemotaxis protein
MTTLKDMQILLVDDDESIRSSMTYYFRKKTHAFLTVETAEEALKLIDSLKWDIIISDYQLPGMNGIAFLDIIGRKHPEIMKILVTAYASLDVATEAIKAGIHDFIQKPFKTETIISSLENLIEKHETRIIAATVNGQQLMEFENVGWEENGDFLIKAIAHQISDSLQTLQGTAELGLLSAEENGEIKSRFSNILDNLSVINHLSDDLKYFGNWLADPIRPVNIVHVLEDRVATCQEKFSSSHIEVFSHFAPDTPKVIQTRKKVFIQRLRKPIKKTKSFVFGRNLSTTASSSSSRIMVPEWMTTPGSEPGPGDSAQSRTVPGWDCISPIVCVSALGGIWIYKARRAVVPYLTSVLLYNRMKPSNIEAEMQDIAVLHDIVLAFHAQFAGFPDFLLGTQGKQILAMIGFGLDKAPLKVGMNNAGRLRGAGTFPERPGPHFGFAGREIGPQAEQIITGLNQAIQTGLFQTDIF